MKKYVLAGFFIVLVLSLAVTVNADKRHWWGGGDDYNYCPNCGTELGPQAGSGYHMRPGVMGRGWGYGMGPGMMGQGQGRGYGMGPGMMGQGQGRGYGMGPGMMGQGWGYGMGPGMTERGSGYGYGQSEQCQKFFNETSDLRKELNTKRFEYSEAIRNPKTKPETIGKLEKEIYEMQEKVYKKAPPGCFY
jgi:hypothetical protein